MDAAEEEEQAPAGEEVKEGENDNDMEVEAAPAPQTPKTPEEGGGEEQAEKKEAAPKEEDEKEEKEDEEAPQEGEKKAELAQPEVVREADEKKGTNDDDDAWAKSWGDDGEWGKDSSHQRDSGEAEIEKDTGDAADAGKMDTKMEQDSGERDKDGAADAGDAKKGEEDTAEEIAAEESDDQGLPEAHKFDLGWEDAGFLLTEDGKHLNTLQKLLDAQLKAKDSGKVRLQLKEGASGKDVRRAEQCIRAMASLRSGSDIEVWPLPEAGISKELCSAVDIPADVKDHIKGKDGKRLKEFFSERGVISAFAWEGQKPAGAEDESVEATKGEEEEEDVLEVGCTVTGKYGAEWHDAELLELGEHIVKVKWSFDGSEDQVVRDHVKKKVEPPEPVEKLLLFGDLRGRLETEIQVLQLVEKKSPGFVAKHRKPQDLDFFKDGVGLTVEKLIEDGKYLPKLVGKGGSMRKKVVAVTGAAVEYIGNDAYIAGTPEEQAVASAMLQTMQRSDDNFQVRTVAPVLDPMSLRSSIPKTALASVLGDKRDNMKRIEDESKTIVFLLAASSSATTGSASSGSKADVDIKEGSKVEVKIKGEWKLGSVLEVQDWGADSDDDDETDGRTVKVKWGDEGKTVVCPIASVREFLEGDAAEQRREKDVELARLRELRTLVVIGTSAEARRATELRVAIAVEAHTPGTYAPDASSPPVCGSLGEGVAVEKKAFAEGEASFCEGDEGAARMLRAGMAAGCVIQEIGSSLYIAGPAAARPLAAEFLKPLLVETPSGTLADDMQEVHKHFVDGEKRYNLTEQVIANIEGEFKVLIFSDDGASMSGMEDSTRFIVCGLDAAKREAAVEKLKEMQEIAPPTADEAQKWGDSGDWEDKDKKEWDTKGDDSWDKEADKSWDSKDDKKWEEDTKWGDKKDWDANKSWEDKGNDAKEWSKKDEWSAKNDWEEKKTWDKKDEWDKGKEWGQDKSWDKKDEQDDWNKQSDWNKKDDWKKQDEWSKKEDWGKKDDWNKKDDWSKKDDWEKKDEWSKEDDWGKKDDDWSKKDDGWSKKDEWAQKSDTQKDWGKAGSWEKPEAWAQSSSWGQKSDHDSTWDHQKGADKQDWDQGRSWGDRQEAASSSSGGGSDWDRDRAPWNRSTGSATGARGYVVPPPAAPAPAPVPWAPRDDDGGFNKRRRVDGSAFNAFGAPSSAGAFEKRPRPPSAPDNLAAALAAQVAVADRVGAPPRKVAKVASSTGVYVQPSARSVAPPPTQRSVIGARRNAPSAAANAYVGAGGSFGDVLEDDGMPAEQEWHDGPVDDPMAQSDPRKILATFENFPDGAEDWLMVQDVVWANHEPLPDGWIRCWSRTYDCEYYARLEDNFTTFERSEVG